MRQAWAYKKHYLINAIGGFNFDPKKHSINRVDGGTIGFDLWRVYGFNVGQIHAEQYLEYGTTSKYDMNTTSWGPGSAWAIDDLQYKMSTNGTEMFIRDDSVHDEAEMAAKLAGACILYLIEGRQYQ